MMVTGDHASTAKSVASSVGLLDESDARAHAVIDGRQLGDVTTVADDQMQELLDAEVFVEHQPEGADALDPSLMDFAPLLIPVDTSDVCLNYDVEWYADAGIAPPTSFEDLIDPTYEGQLVVENPATSAPGAAFLFATIAHTGESGFADYWKALVDNDLRVDEDWDTAYYGSFTQGETKFYPFKIFRRSAEHAYEKFARGDNFVASGHVQKFSYEKNGETVSGEEFIATHIGPDAARTSYAVDRGRSRSQQVESAPIEAPDPTLSQQPSPRPMTL